MMLYWQRFSFGLHRLLLQPKFSLPVILSLGLTLSAVLTVLTLCNSILWQPLPGIKQADELSVHRLSFAVGGMDINLIDPASFADYSDALAAYGDWGFLVQSKTRLQNQDRNTPAITEFTASAGLTELLGLPILAGDSTKNAEQQGVWISESLWRRKFQGRLDAIGERLQLEQGDYLVRGIVQDFYAAPFKDNAMPEQVWHFFQPDEQMAQLGTTSMGSMGVAILRQQQGMLPSEQDILNWLEQFQQEQPVVAMMAQHFQLTPSASDYRQHLLRDSLPLLTLLLLVTLVLLAMATLNLTNLLVGHYQSRQHEFAIQSFCGCSRSKLRRLVAAENLPMMLATVLLGVLGALWLLQWLPELAGSSLPLVQSIQLDTISLSLLALLVGLLLAVFSWPVGSNSQLSQQLSGSGKGSPQQQRPWLHHSLLLAQLVLSGSLVFGAGFIAVSAYQELYQNWGFQMRNSLQLSIEQKQLPAAAELSPALARQQQQQWQQQLADQWPEAQILLGSAPISNQMTVTKTQQPGEELSLDAISKQVDPAYFASFSVPLLHGTTFQSGDSEQSVILDSRLAQLLKPQQPEQLIGQSVSLWGDKNYLVVGIAAATKNFLMDLPTLYLASEAVLDEQSNSVRGHFNLIFPDQQPLSDAAMIDAIQQLDPGYQVDAIGTQDLWLKLTSEQRMHLYLITLLSAVSLLLALLGIAGVSRQNSQQRCYELAIRLATGASQQQLLWWLAKIPLALVLTGLSTAALLSALLYRQLTTQLADLPAFDTSMLLMLNGLLLLVALPALLLPGWQVIRRDPMQTLRSL